MLLIKEFMEMKSKLLPITSPTILASVIGVIAVGSLFGYQPISAKNANESENSLASENTKERQIKITQTQSEEQTRIRVYEKANPAVVAIATLTGHGSGFIVSPDGLVLTNAHVVQDAASPVAVVLADGKQVLADVVGFAPEGVDLAALKIRNQENLPFLRLAAPGSVRVGQSVYAIGSPLKVERFRNSLSYGVVSRIDTKNALIQHDAAVNHGNSGGPLLNSNAELIGVNSLIYTENGGFIGISLAIPTDVVQPFLVATQKGKSSLVTSRQQPSNTKSQNLALDGQVVQASLKKGDAVFPNNSYFKTYAFEGKAGQRLTFQMTSKQIDPKLYLVLTTKDERLLAQNDDISPNDFNATLSVILPEDGVYYLLAVTSEPGESGDYSLRAVAK